MYIYVHNYVRIKEGDSRLPWIFYRGFILTRMDHGATSKEYGKKLFYSVLKTSLSVKILTIFVIYFTPTLYDIVIFDSSRSFSF